MKPWENNRDCIQKGRGKRKKVKKKEVPSSGKSFHVNQTLGPRTKKKNQGVKEKLGTKNTRRKKRKDRDT